MRSYSWKVELLPCREQQIAAEVERRRSAQRRRIIQPLRGDNVVHDEQQLRMLGEYDRPQLEAAFVPRRRTGTI